MASRSDFSELKSLQSLIGLYVYPEVASELTGLWIGGASDEGLTEEGKEQVSLDARMLKKHRSTLRRIVSSPELRAVQAADFIHDQVKVKWATLSEFRDQDLGAFEGSAKASPIRGEVALEPDRGESRDAFLIRIREGLVRVLEPRESVLLVVHPRVARAILEWVGGVQVIELKGVILEPH